MSYKFPEDERYLSDYNVAQRFDVSRITIWRWAGQNKFPKPVKLSDNCTRWRLSEILAWEDENLPTAEEQLQKAKEV